MEYLLRQHQSHSPQDPSRRLVLGGDVGGTHTNLALAWAGNRKVSLAVSFHFPTPGLRDLAAPLREIAAYAKRRYGAVIEHAALALAGPIIPGRTAQLTNADLRIDPGSLKHKVGLRDLHLMNDFDAIGYGINFLRRGDVLEMPPRRPSRRRADHPTRAIIGAGTGLGKSILIYDKSLGLFRPHPSEGGHADFPSTAPWERELVDFIKTREPGKQTVSYEDLLSGRGLERLYQFLRQRQPTPPSPISRQIDRAEEKALLISQHIPQDETCRETFHLLLQLMAKCARNFALDTLALGGIFLAGGILAKNIPHLRTDLFRQSFEENDRHREILQQIPIKVVTNYDVSLYGAAFAATLQG